MRMKMRTVAVTLIWRTALAHPAYERVMPQEIPDIRLELNV